MLAQARAWLMLLALVPVLAACDVLRMVRSVGTFVRDLYTSERNEWLD